MLEFSVVNVLVNVVFWFSKVYFDVNGRFSLVFNSKLDFIYPI